MSQLPNKTRKVLTFILTAASLTTALVIISSPAQAATIPSCTVQAQAPYRHVRVTGQKQVYGHGVIVRCVNATGNPIPSSSVGARVTAKLQHYNGSAFVTYPSSSTEVTSTDTLAHAWLCTTSGFGGTVPGTNFYNGYFQTQATVSLNWAGRTYSATHTSAYRLLSCR